MGFTLPNLVTIARMVLVPPFIMLVVSNRPGWALAVFATAGISDALDGFVARRFGQRSELGAFLDPVADKLLVTAALVVLSIPDHPASFPHFVLLNRFPILLTILTISRDVFITCAVTGSGATQDRSAHVPRSPRDIAASAIAAARAGAAIVHCHVRDPVTGKASRDPRFYREVVDRIRDSATDVVINLTAGMGGDLVLGPPEAPLPINAAGTDMGSAEDRMRPIADCLPEICTLDCGTMNFAEADYVMTNTPGMLRKPLR